MQIIESSISSVTVFTDRAQIVRRGKLKLSKGEHSISFDNLPSQIEKSSLQVSGKGEATIYDVRYNTVYFTTIQDKTIKELEDKKELLQDKQNDLTARINNAEKERQFVEDITKRITTPVEKSESEDLNPQNWMKMVQFYRNKLDSLTEEITRTHREIRLLKSELSTLNHQISIYGQQDRKSKNIAEVIVDMHQDGDLYLQLSYIVYGASWKPFYDLRVSTELRNMNLSYRAYVQQNTGENWENIEIKLSTAQPNISASQPELSAWRVNFFLPPPAPPAYEREFAMAKSIAPKLKKRAAKLKEEEDEELNIDAVFDMMSPMPEVEKPTAVVETKSTSVIFYVGGKHNIASDNKEHSLSIFVQEFDAEFRYSSVPKLSPYAYLRAKVKNTTEYPFLAGKTHIFLDNSFVANGHLALVAPTEEFLTSLGVDESIKVERKFVTKYRKDEGIFSKKSHIAYEYLIVLKNNKKTEEEITIQDHIPISGNKEIVVELIEPKYKEDTDNLKKLLHETLEWRLKLKAGEEIKIPFKFSVEYPRDKDIIGLD